MKDHHHLGHEHPANPNSRTAIHEAISLRAYELWERAGKPENRSEMFWLRAERELVTGLREPDPELKLPVSF